MPLDPFSAGGLGAADNWVISNLAKTVLGQHCSALLLGVRKQMRCCETRLCNSCCNNGLSVGVHNSKVTWRFWSHEIN